MKILEGVKKIGTGIKESVCDFFDDTIDYLEEHPWVLGTVVNGAFTLLLTGMLIGCRAAENEISEAYKNNAFKMLVNGKKFKKDMSFDEGMKYIDFYNTKGNNWKKCQEYLRNGGYID